MVGRDVRWLMLALGLSLGGPAIAEAQDAPEEHAAAAPRRVVVEPFAGPAGSAVRSEVVRALGTVEGIEIVSQSEMSGVIGEGGAGGEAQYASVASDLRASAFVTGTVSRGPRNRGFVVTFQVRDGASGAIVGESRLSARRRNVLTRTVRSTFVSRLGSKIGETQAPSSDTRAMYDEAPPAVVVSDASTDELLAQRDSRRRASLDDELFPEANDESESEEAEEEEEAPNASPPFVAENRALEARAGIALFNRSLTYTDDTEGEARPYALPLGPGLSLGATLYPGALFSNGLVSNLGLDLGFEQSVGLDSQGPIDERTGEPVTYSTSDSAFSIGARLRIPLGTDSELFGQLGYGIHSFSVERGHPRDPMPEVASVGYSHLRLGLGGRASLGALALTFGAGYRLVLDPGDVASKAFYPGASAQGIDANLGIAYPITAGIELTAAVDMRLYLLTFDPSQQGAPQVGGAVDRYITGTIGAAWRPAAGFF